MNHEKIKEHLYEVYDGEASPEITAIVESHLGACSECQLEFQSWKKTSALLFQSKSPVEPSEYFVTRVMSRLPDSSSQEFESRLGFFWKPVLVMGSFLFFVWTYLASNGGNSDSIEAILLADGRSASVATWMMKDGNIASDEFARYALEGE